MNACLSETRHDWPDLLTYMVLSTLHCSIIPFCIKNFPFISKQFRNHATLQKSQWLAQIIQQILSLLIWPRDSNDRPQVKQNKASLCPCQKRRRKFGSTKLFATQPPMTTWSLISRRAPTLLLARESEQVTKYGRPDHAFFFDAGARQKEACELEGQLLIQAEEVEN